MPGVGRIASLTFLAAVDEVGRFSSSRKLVSYSGLCPVVRASGERTQYGPISREGRSGLRAVWVQVAHRVANDSRVSTRSLRRWFSRLASRRGKKTATVALTRKLLTIAYHIVKYEQDYDPAHLGGRRRNSKTDDFSEGSEVAETRSSRAAWANDGDSPYVHSLAAR